MRSRGGYRLALVIVAFVFCISSCGSSYRYGPIARDEIATQRETVLWTLDGTKHVGTIWSVDDDSLLFRTDVPGEAGVVRVALQDIEMMRVEEEPGGPSAPTLVKVGFWGLMGFAVLVLIVVAGGGIDASPDFN